MVISTYTIVFELKGKHNFKLLTVYIHIIEIPTNKGANSYKGKLLKIGDCHINLNMCFEHKESRVRTFYHPILL